MMSLSTRLQNLNLTNFDLDEAIELVTAAEGLRQGYEKHLASPEWLDDAIRSLNRFIQTQAQDRVELRLRELNQADAADMTASERREARKKEREALEAKLGRTPTTV